MKNNLALILEQKLLQINTGLLFLLYFLVNKTAYKKETLGASPRYVVSYFSIYNIIVL